MNLKNNIKKVLGQMVEEKKTKTANDVVIDKLFGGPDQRISKSLEMTHQICNKLGVSYEGKDFIQVLIDINEKLTLIPFIPYPVSISTVDVLPISFDENMDHMYILLGRKEGFTTFQLIGGFRDPKETSEEAASRELREEGLAKELHEEFKEKLPPQAFKYIKSIFVDDKRYKNSCHKITTSLFFVGVQPEDKEKFTHGDDIEETRWFDYQELISGEWEKTIRDVHQNLFREIISVIDLD